MFLEEVRLMAKRRKMSKEYQNLYPKFKCPKCKDWFHMPYKFCECSQKCPVVKEYIKSKGLNEYEAFTNMHSADGLDGKLSTSKL